MPGSSKTTQNKVRMTWVTSHKWRMAVMRNAKYFLIHTGICNAEEHKLFPTSTVDWASNKLSKEISQWVGRWLSAVTSFKGTAGVLLLWLPTYLKIKEFQKLRKAWESFVAYSLFHAHLQEETSNSWDLHLRKGHRDQKLQSNKMRTASAKVVRG